MLWLRIKSNNEKVVFLAMRIQNVRIKGKFPDVDARGRATNKTVVIAICAILLHGVCHFARKNPKTTLRKHFIP